METRARKYREDVHLLEEAKKDIPEDQAAEIDKDIEAKKSRYQGILQEYKDFSKKMGLPMQKERIYQDGLNVKMEPKADSGTVNEATANVKKTSIKSGLAAVGDNKIAEQHDPPVYIRKVLDTESREEILSEYEHEIVNSPIEIAMVITKDGDLYRCSGTPNGVYPDVDLGEKLFGADVTHNHPADSLNEYSFSSSDVKLFEKYRLNTLRGIDPLFVYKMDRNPKDIDEHVPIIEFDEYSARHDSVITLAEKYGFGYRRRKRG